MNDDSEVEEIEGFEDSNYLESVPGSNGRIDDGNIQCTFQTPTNAVGGGSRFNDSIYFTPLTTIPRPADPRFSADHKLEQPIGEMNIGTPFADEKISSPDDSNLFKTPFGRPPKTKIADLKLYRANFEDLPEKSPIRQAKLEEFQRVKAEARERARLKSDAEYGLSPTRLEKIRERSHSEKGPSLMPRRAGEEDQYGFEFKKENENPVANQIASDQESISPSGTKRKNFLSKLFPFVTTSPFGKQTSPKKSLSEEPGVIGSSESTKEQGLLGKFNFKQKNRKPNRSSSSDLKSPDLKSPDLKSPDSYPVGEAQAAPVSGRSNTSSIASSQTAPRATVDEVFLDESPILPNPPPLYSSLDETDATQKVERALERLWRQQVLTFL